MSPTHTEWPVIPAADPWRPMAFGFKDPSHIRDPLAEPLWGGERVLVEVAGRDVRIRDVDGGTIDGYDGLRDALAMAADAGELVLDGYMVPAESLAEPIGEDALEVVATTPSSAQMARQMMLGSIGQNRHKDMLEAAEARVVNLPPDSPTGFVAIDLLWLDGQALLDVPLQERRRLLDSALGDHELVRRTIQVRYPVSTWYGQWRSFGFREFAIKDANSRYVPGGESDHWTTAAIPRR